MNIEYIELLLKKIDTAVALIENLKKREKNYIVEIAKLKAKIRILEKENLNYQTELKKTDAMHEQLEAKIQEILQHIPDNIDEIEDIDIENIEIEDITEEATDNLNIQSPVNIQFENNEEIVDDSEIHNNDNKDSNEEDNEGTPSVVIENDEERLKQFINNPDTFEKKGLFIEEENKIEKKNKEENKNNSLENSDNNSDILTDSFTGEPNNNDNSSIEQTNNSQEALEQPPTNFEDTLLSDDKEDINFEFDTNTDLNTDNEELPQGVL